MSRVWYWKQMCELELFEQHSAIPVVDLKTTKYISKKFIYAEKRL